MNELSFLTRMISIFSADPQKDGKQLYFWKCHSIPLTSIQQNLKNIYILQNFTQSDVREYCVSKRETVPFSWWPFLCSWPAYCCCPWRQLCVEVTFHSFPPLGSASTRSFFLFPRSVCAQSGCAGTDCAWWSSVCGKKRDMTCMWSVDVRLQCKITPPQEL